MKLAVFLEKEGPGSLARLARAVGVKHTSVQRWRDEKSVPRPGHMRALKRESRGKVTERDFYR